MSTTDTSRARRHITALAEEAQKTIQPDATDPGSLFMSGVVNGLAMAKRILDGATAEQALGALETSVATIVGRAHLAGQLGTPTDAPGAH
jgi:hypothetical protein